MMIAVPWAVQCIADSTDAFRLGAIAGVLVGVVLGITVGAYLAMWLLQADNDPGDFDIEDA